MDDRIDLSPLDPAGDPVRFESLLSLAVNDAVKARAARPAGVVRLLELSRWSRPLLAAAAAIAVIASATLVVAGRSPASGPESLAELAGIPHAVAHWAESGERPAVADLAAGVARGGTR